MIVLITKNTWVQISRVILTPENRAKNIPDDTSICPLTMWVKGFLLDNANLGDEVSVKTITGRIEFGTLVQIHPTYHHNYGEFVPELLVIDQMVKNILFGGESHE